MMSKEVSKNQSTLFLCNEEFTGYQGILRRIYFVKQNTATMSIYFRKILKLLIKYLSPSALLSILINLRGSVKYGYISTSPFLYIILVYRSWAVTCWHPLTSSNLSPTVLRRRECFYWESYSIRPIFQVAKTQMWKSIINGSLVSGVSVYLRVIRIHVCFQFLDLK